MPATCRRLIDQAADVAAQQQVGKLLCTLRESLEVTESLLSPLGVPGAQCRRYHDLEQAALAVGRGAKGAQVARVDPEAPECAIFLDDVTVSRKHAVFTQDGDHWQLEDQGSLNGTFVNRERVETAELSDGDELQIGKYRLTFLQR